MGSRAGYSIRLQESSRLHDTHISYLIIILTTLLNIVTATPTTSDFHATITTAGINQISSFIVPIIDDVLKGQVLHLPNINLDTHVVEPIGHITVNLTNITVSGLSLGALPINVASPSSFVGALDNFNLQINLGYKWRKIHWPHASDHGTVNVIPENVTGTISFGVVSNNSRPLLNNVQTSLSFGSFNIQFHGKVAWLYNLLMKSLKGKITNAITNAFSNLIDKKIQTINTNFSQMEIHRTIGGGKSKIVVDLSFLGADVHPVNSSFIVQETNQKTNPQKYQAAAPPLGNYISFDLAMDIISSTTSKRCDYAFQPNIPEQAPSGLGDKDLVQLVLGQVSIYFIYFCFLIFFI